MPRIYGADVSEAVSPDGWQRLAAEHAVRFAIVRCYRDSAGGIPDQDCPATVNSALAAGIDDVGVYHFPVVSTKTPEQQAQESLDFLEQNGVGFNCLWLDVEIGRASWNEDPSVNVDFIERFVASVGDEGIQTGIYCGTAGWNEITASSTAFSTLPLWWSSHGLEFEAFGGWTSPAVIQFRYGQVTAGVSFDGDYRLV